MSEATFEGATVEAALEAAAATTGAAVTDLEYEVVEKKVDFWGTGGDTVVIRAWQRVEAPAEAEQPAEEETEEAAAELPEEVSTVASSTEERPAEDPPATTDEETESPAVTTPETVEAAVDAPYAGAAEVEQEADTPPVAAADIVAVERITRPAEAEDDEQEGVEPAAISAMLEQIFHDMEFECTVEVEAEEEGFLATVEGADKEALLEGNGRCLSALELLINNAFRHKLPRGHKVRVDAGDFRNRRDEELSDLALQVAHSAKESGRTQETQPLNPYERRLVHLALAEDPAVTTRSRGSGFLKNVQVIPRAGGSGRSRGRRD